eukprot:TRINITY_DN57552_c0_g1_i1.p1 TRINITY_DN57552_c0_g1~~TRINITY_DN57552_c0_g1_i1.p1  ORF type:complete len:197 (-),score=20.05 TRINITY_DN57552_c0_g1_i1:61-651(-)
MAIENVNSAPCASEQSTCIEQTSAKKSKVSIVSMSGEEVLTMEVGHKALFGRDVRHTVSSCRQFSGKRFRLLIGDRDLLDDDIITTDEGLTYPRISVVLMKPTYSVVVWGDPEYGGDCSRVAHRLKSGVISLSPKFDCFVAIKEGGGVVAWGNPSTGGDTSKVDDQLESGVTSVLGNAGAFAAIKQDGSVVAWGHD